MSQSKKMSKYPCGICEIGVRYQAICCKGVCKKWYHSKCLNWTDKRFKALTTSEIDSWECNNCKTKPKEVQIKLHSLTLNESANQETKLCDLSIEDALQKVKNYEQQEGDLEASLSLAAEVGNSLLATNLQLNQEIDRLKIQNNNLIAQILGLKKENAEIIEDSEQELKTREEMVHALVEKNNNLEQELDYFKRKLEKEISIKEDLIYIEEQEKQHFKKQINTLNKTNLSLSTKIKTLENQLQCLTNNKAQENMTTTKSCLALLGNQ